MDAIYLLSYSGFDDVNFSGYATSLPDLLEVVSKSYKETDPDVSITKIELEPDTQRIRIDYRYSWKHAKPDINYLSYIKIPPFEVSKEKQKASRN